MKIYTVNAGKSFKAHLHFVVYDSADFLISASYADLDTNVKAIGAAAIDGRSFTILDDNNKILVELSSTPSDYRRVERPTSGPITHGVLTNKAAIFDESKEAPVILARDGNIRDAVGKFMAAKYALPKHWIQHYYDIFPADGVEELNVLINSLNNSHQNLKAIRISSDYTSDEYVLGQIDRWLKNGKLVVPPAPDEDMPKGQFDPSWSMKEYMTQNAHVLAAQLNNVRPHHIPGQDPLNPEIAKMARVPFPSQAHMIQGLYNCLQTQFSAFCGADMGCGKTIMALGVANLIHKAKGSGTSILVAAPGITIPKWAGEEISQTLPDTKIRILSSTEDAARYAREVRNGYKPKGIEFVLVGIDRAKFGPEPWCAARWERVQGEYYNAWHCPECGFALEDPDADEDETDTLAFWNVMAKGSPPESPGYDNQEDTLFSDSIKTNTNNLPSNFPVKWNTRSKLKKCNHCKSKLWRPAVKNRGETKNRPRYYISRILKKLREHFDLFICDEVHQTKAQDSGRGDAFAQMVRSAKKCLFLTGTLVNGKSTSIKEILWRTDAQALINEGFNRNTGMVSWAARYGVLKRVTTVKEEDLGVTTRQKRTQLQPTEEPGIAPEMVAQYLLHKAAFMELGDLGLPVVKLDEKPVFIDMDEDAHGPSYKAFHDELYDEAKKLARVGIKTGFARFIPSTICYGDRPDLGAWVKLGKDDDAKVVAAPKLDPNYYHAKEREMVRIVKQELKEKRRVIVSCTYTDSYGVHWRLRDVLAAHGIKADVLTASVPTEKRMEWVNRKVDEGCKVLITNMKLLEVGVDLIAFNTLIAMQLTFDVNTVRQFARRHWRIGAYRDCRVRFLVYNSTYQMSQFLNVMSKRGHALMAEGRLDRSELSEFARDAHSSMACDLASCLANANVADKWTELAKKDMDQNVKMVDEKYFENELHKTMKELVEETKRLCGVITDDTIEKLKSKRPTIEDMWHQVQDQETKKPKKRRKKKQDEEQLSLFDLGA